MPHVFVYGTLLAPEMMSTVTGKAFDAAPAVARGYKRAYLSERVYPGIVANEGNKVHGAVYLDVDDESIRRLDYFEGPEYLRGPLVACLKDGRELLAEAYIVPEINRHMLTEREWSLEYFLAQDLTAFIARAQNCMEGFKAGGV